VAGVLVNKSSSANALYRTFLALLAFISDYIGNNLIVSEPGGKFHAKNSDVSTGRQAGKEMHTARHTEVFKKS
jgi:hypothetical protein